MAVGTGETKTFLANGAILAAPALKGPRNTIAFFQVSSAGGGYAFSFGAIFLKGAGDVRGPTPGEAPVRSNIPKTVGPKVTRPHPPQGGPRREPPGVKHHPPLSVRGVPISQDPTVCPVTAMSGSVLLVPVVTSCPVLACPPGRGLSSWSRWS